MTEALFVHGDLRPEQPQFWRLERYATNLETVTVHGYSLHAASDPILLKTGLDTDTVTGEIVTLEDNAGAPLLAALDRINVTYGQTRTLITVETADGPRDVWAYVATDSAGTRVENGDWNTLD